MCYVERLIEQLRRPGVIKIVMRLTEYYEEYRDYAGKCDVTITHEMTDDGWISTTCYTDTDENNHAEQEVHASYDDVIDSIIDDLYCERYSVSSLKTYADGDTVGIDINFSR